MSKTNFFDREDVKVVLGIAGAIGIIAFLIKIFGRNFDKDAEASRRESYSRIRPTYPDYVYKDFADTLDTAILRESSEDENAVYGVFEKCRNISDVNKIIEAFGKRRQMFTLTWIGLPAAINNYFSFKEKVKLNGILAKKGIKYQFA